MRPYLILALAASMLNVPGAIGAPSRVKPDVMEFQDYGNVHSVPGGGFDYKKNQFSLYSCLAGEESEPIGKPEANVDFSMAMDSQATKRELGVSADFKTKMGTGELSGGAKFAKATSESSTSITLNYVGTVRFANRNFEQTGVNAETKRDARLPSLLEQRCGQGFVKQIVRGAKLFFSIRFDFGSRDDKEAFGAELHYNSPMATVNAEMSSKAETLSKHARVTVSAYQLGGKVEKLAYILKNTARKNAKPQQGETEGVKKTEQTDKVADVKAHYAAIECAMGAGLAECSQALSDALAYATDKTDPDSFPKQFDDVDPKGDAVKKYAANLSYIVVPYAYPEFVKIPGLIEAVEENKKTLVAWLTENVTDLETIGDLRRGVIIYNERQQKVLSGGESTLRKRQEPIIKTGIYCYQQDEMGCGEKVAVLQNLLDEKDSRGRPIPGGNGMRFDKAILEPMPETFAQFCAATHSIKPKYVDLGQRESVLAIEQSLVRPDSKLLAKLTAAGYSKENSDSIRNCAIMETVLLTQNELDLSYRKEDYKITNLEVIANLTQLQSLKLRYQKVREIKTLADFKDLKTLDLEGNQIADVSPLAANKRLETLRLAANQIASVTALQGLPSLTLIDIRKNLPAVQCFNSPSLKQCMLARSKWVVQFTNTTNTVDLGLLFGQSSEFAGGYVVSGARQGHRSNYVAVLDKAPQGVNGFNARLGKLAVSHVWSADTKVDDTRVLVTGGWPNASMNTMELYDAAGGYRLAGGTMGDARAAHTATRLDSGAILVAGGYASNWSIGTDSAQSTAEMINPLAQGGPKVLEHLEMNAPRAWHTATKLADGRVLFIGGFAGSRAVRSMEVYDPKLNKFLPAGNLKQARGGHTITELSEGKYLIAGGFQDNASAVERAEILEVSPAGVISTRYTKGSMNFARGAHMAQRLPNGEIVFAGGMSQPIRTEDKKDDDGLLLIDMKDTSFDFKVFPNRDKDGKEVKNDKNETQYHPGVCQICLDSAEVYLPEEESFVPNPESLNSRRAGSTLVPVNTGTGLFSFRIWGGLDAATSMTLESGTVTEDVLN